MLLEEKCLLLDRMAIRLNDEDIPVRPIISINYNMVEAPLLSNNRLEMVPRTASIEARLQGKKVSRHLQVLNSSCRRTESAK